MKKCIIEDCSGEGTRKGLCNKHYKRQKRNGDALLVKRTNNRHGFTKISEYAIWTGMKQRCYNQNHTHFKYYGGRGITVCDSWLNSFENFYQDMGKRPPKFQLDRIDSNGNYEPSNCRWVLAKVNQQNRRHVKLNEMIVLEIRKELELGKKQKDISTRYGISVANVSLIKLGEAWK